MKCLRYIVISFCFLVSCEDRSVNEPTIPDWLKPRLEELETSGVCLGCTVQRSTYNNEYFYDVYCSYWSCLYCEVYSNDGTVVEWSESFPLSDWLENRTRLLILWECGDELNID